VVDSYAFTPGAQIGKLSLTNSINQFVQSKIIDPVTASTLVNKLWLDVPGVGTKQIKLMRSIRWLFLMLPGKNQNCIIGRGSCV